MLECAERIADYTKGGRQAFLASRMIQDSVARNFEVMGEAAKRVSEATRSAYPRVPWRRVAGFRDVLIHGYEVVLPEEVWEAVGEDLPALVQELRAIVEDRRWE